MVMRHKDKKHLFSIRILLLVPAFIVMLGTCSYAASYDDGYIRGYAASIIEREFGLEPFSLTVRDGILYISAEDIERADSGALVSALLRIEGVKRVEIQGSGESGAGGVPVYSGPVEESESIQPDAGMSVNAAGYRKERLFDPLLADPRWPSFSGGYQFYMGDDEFERMFLATVGDIVPLYTDEVPFSFGGTWQFGAEAGAFIVHNHDTVSWDQVNADYLLGLTLAYRKESFSGMFRLFHFSSHIGDEYLLHNDVERENYSFEAFGLTLSKDVDRWVRLYGGGEFRFSRSPKELKPFVLQYGIELECPRTFMKNILRPVAATNISHRQDNDWSGEISLQAGVRIENEMLINHKVRFMLAYYNGHSPNGQFYKKSVEYFSLGIYYNF